MSLNSSDLAKIANLSRLELSLEKSPALLEQMNRFFEMAQIMQAIDTREVAPLTQPLAAIQEVALRLNADVVSETNQREANQRNAPSVERGLFLVPRVVE